MIYQIKVYITVSLKSRPPANAANHKNYLKKL